jgi:hypothetical protein
MKLYILVIMFFLLGAFFIISEKELSLNTSESRQEFFKAYIGWMDQVVDNAKHLSGYVIKLDWLPKNNTG